jgi:hypothetical protein
MNDLISNGNLMVQSKLIVFLFTVSQVAYKVAF